MSIFPTNPKVAEAQGTSYYFEDNINFQGFKSFKPSTKPTPDTRPSVLEQLLSSELPDKVRSVVTGILSDGVMGGLDAAVFNNLFSLPDEVIGVAQSLFQAVKSTSQVSEIIDKALNINDLSGIYDVIDQAAGVVETFGDLKTDTTTFLQSFGSFEDFALPGTNIVRTASNILSTTQSLASGITPMLSQGFGAQGASMLMGAVAPQIVVANLIAPSVGSLFGLKKNICPCHYTCKVYDHFITEDGTKLVDKCGPLMMTSPSGLQIEDALSAIA